MNVNHKLDTMLEAAGTAPLTGEPARAAARFVDRAAAEGLADVAYATVDSPLGPLLAAATPRGLVRLAYDHNDFDAVLDRLAARTSPRVIEAPGRLDEVRRELEDYFAGDRRHFELAIDWALVGPFARRVLEATAGIAYGDLSTYKEVAARAGNPRASRATGNALGANPVPIVVPCHRVVRTGGGLGGYTGGLDNKRALLAIEGVEP
ncbi:MAG: methylated-DNA--[protein]-cysteine S-methyltransferase [Solirubrobacteraceae bacterium]